MMVSEAERVRVTAVARITSLSPRKVQELAVAGRIPSAAKLGGVWTFDPARVRAWIREQERRCLASPETSTSAAVSGGDVSRLPDVSIDEAYARLIPAKRRGAYGAGGSNLSAQR